MAGMSQERRMSGEALEASRETDARVAELVFGWHGFHTLHEQDSPSLPVFATLYGVNPTDHEWPEEVPRYSTEIAAVWEVVERMGPRLESIYPAYDPEGGRLLHWVAVTTDGRWESRRGHTAPTAPLAICRAALAATDPAPKCAVEQSEPTKAHD